jgi:hypothetical protein
MKKPKSKRVLLCATVYGWISDRIVAHIPADTDDNELQESIMMNWPNSFAAVLDEQTDSNLDVKSASRRDACDARYERGKDGDLQLVWSQQSTD